MLIGFFFPPSPSVGLAGKELFEQGKKKDMGMRNMG